MPAHLPFDLWLRCFSTRIQVESSSLGANYIFHKYRWPSAWQQKAKCFTIRKSWQVVVMTILCWSFGGDYGIYKCLGLFIPCASSSSCLLLSHYITWDKILQGLTPRGRIITIYLSSLLWISLAPSDIFGLILQTTVLICYTRLCTYFLRPNHSIIRVYMFCGSFRAGGTSVVVHVMSSRAAFPANFLACLVPDT